MQMSMKVPPVNDKAFGECQTPISGPTIPRKGGKKWTTSHKLTKQIWKARNKQKSDLSDRVPFVRSMHVF